MKSHAIFLFITLDMCLRYLKIDSVNPLRFIINKINGYNEESNVNKYLGYNPCNSNFFASARKC